MVFKATLLFGICLISGAYSQVAQLSQPSLEIPTGPLLKHAPEFSSWITGYTYPDDRPSAGGEKPIVLEYLNLRPRKVVTTKTKDVVQELTYDLKGRQILKWYVGSTQYFKSGDSGWSQLAPDSNNQNGPDSRYTPLPPEGFRDVGWISKETYAGTVNRWGRDCFVFVPGGADKLNLSDRKDHIAELDAQKQIAYVDAKTRLPVYMKVDDVTSIYTFSPPPTAMQTLPQDLDDAIKKGVQGRLDLFRPALAP